MKKFSASMLVLLMVFSILPAGVFPVYAATGDSAQFAGGSGIESDPYLIETKEQLNNVRNDLDAHYKMIADIVFTEADFAEGGDYYNDGHGWIPIGDETKPFTGSFDGGGHTISELSFVYDFEDAAYIGLFGYSNGSIKNINITNNRMTITADSTEQSSTYTYVYVGAIVGYGVVEDCHHSGVLDITCNSTTKKYDISAGGLIGRGSAANCSNSGQLTATITSSSGKYVDVRLGGIAGYADTITQCNNTGRILANTARNDSYLTVGGIAGQANKIEQSSNSAPISAKTGSMFGHVYVGGICGCGSSGSVVNQCYNSGIIEGSSESSAGGIVGYIGGSGSVRDCFNTGSVAGGCCAGIVGNAFGDAFIYNCYNIGFIKDGYYKYSMLGTASDYVIENCYSLEGMAKTRTNTIACTPEAMEIMETYDGFDFDSVWILDANTPYPWPELRNLQANIDVLDVGNCDITLDKTEYQYHTSPPQVSVMHNGVELVLNQDYIVIYIVGNNLGTTQRVLLNDVGPARMVVSGIGAYVGVKIIEFEVVPFDMANARLYTPWIPNGDGSNSSYSYDMKNFEYDGTEKMQSGYRVCDDNDTISAEYYEVTYKNNVEVGTATMIITGKGDYYTGTLEKEFEIRPRAIEKIEITRLPDKLTYQVGESFDPSGMVVTAYYKNNTSAVVTSFNMSGYSFTLGTKTITVTHEGKTATFTVEVVAAVTAGWNYQNGAWYYYYANGAKATGWVYDGAWYYLNADGRMATGWVYDGAWYYMDGSGAMQTGWLNLGGTWYYMNGSGAMMTGWLNLGGTWYYLTSSGAMATGWVNDGGTWYYMNASGAMMTGWVNLGGTWYYLTSSGAMATGWVNDGGTWYYMNASGAMQTGWILDGGVWYYLNASGAWVA